MARTKKTVTTDVSVTEDTNEVFETSIPDSNFDMLQQMKSMMNEITRLRLELEMSKSGQTLNLNEKLDGFEYVPVMSLYKYKVNLTTENKGRGTKYTFNKFGEIKNIMFNDLSKIVNVIPSFFEKGYVYIASPKVVHQLGMDEMYKDILNKETMERAIAGKADSIMLYNTANKWQKEVIRDFLITKIRDNPESVDMSLIIAFERDAGLKLMELAEQSKDLQLPKK